MEKKYQKLYIWSFIIISGLVLAMLYTPLGGNLHNSTYGNYDNYTTPGVNFNGRIGNAPKGGRATQARNYNDEIPVNSGSTYSVLSKPVVVGNNGSTSHSNLQNGNYQTGKLGSSKSNDGLAGGSGSGSGMIALGGGRSGGSTSGATGSYSGGGLFSSTSPSATTEGVMQKGTTNFGDELADPGGGDPTGNPIPAGDGFKVLILFGLLYGYFKYRQNQKTITH